MTTKVRSSTLLSVANTQITGNIVSSQITSVANTQITGTVASANTVTSQHFTIQESGGKLVIQYNGSTVISIDSTGNIISANNITAGGTP
jgi:hypothetical protein